MKILTQRAQSYYMDEYEDEREKTSARDVRKIYMLPYMVKTWKHFRIDQFSGPLHSECRTLAADATAYLNKAGLANMQNSLRLE